jgi:hypothetical protein
MDIRKLAGQVLNTLRGDRVGLGRPTPVTRQHTPAPTPTYTQHPN